MNEYTTITYAAVPFRCPVCEGRGTMLQDFYTRMTVGNGADDVECRTCEGDGIIWSRSDGQRDGDN